MSLLIRRDIFHHLIETIEIELVLGGPERTARIQLELVATGQAVSILSAALCSWRLTVGELSFAAVCGILQPLLVPDLPLTSLFAKTFHSM